MVSVVHSVAAQSGIEHTLQTLCAGLSAEESERVRQAVEFAQSVYGDRALGSGRGRLASRAGHGADPGRPAARRRLPAGPRCSSPCRPTTSTAWKHIEKRFGPAAAHLVGGISRLNRMRPITRGFVAHAPESGEQTPDEMKAQIEILRKMFLAVVEDIRVVLLRLASRTQTLRHYADAPDDLRVQVARETLELYSPLANRLGVWELKWELEDLSFRFLYPDIYKKIARQLDEKRAEREQFIADAVRRLRGELEAVGIADAEVYGRPKHIYSIWNKMRKKGVEFSEVYDVRARCA